MGSVINLGYTEGRTLHRVSYEEYAAKGTLAQIASYSNVQLPPVSAVSENPAIPAFIYRDNLIVGCEDCRDYQLVWRDTPLFMCSRNAGMYERGRAVPPRHDPRRNRRNLRAA